METNQFEERMKRLKKGYEEMEERTDTKKVISALTNKEPERSKRPKKNWIVPLISVAAIFTLFLFAMSLVNPPTNSASEEEVIYEEEPLISALDMDLKLLSSMLKEQFEQMEEEQFAKSGLTREQYFSMPSVERAKQVYARYMTGEIDDYYFGVSEEVIVPLMIKELKYDMLTPREILERVKEDFQEFPLDLHMSSSLLQTYTWRHQEYEHAKLGEGMAYTRINNADRDLLDELLNPMVAPILDFYEVGPIMYAGDMLIKLEVLPELFIPMEAVYARDEITLSEEKHELATLLFLSAKGTMSQNVDEQQDNVFENGVVKQEFREVWKRYAEQPEYTLSALIFRPIVEQMEQTNWTKSEAWIQFDYEDALAHLSNLDNGFYGSPEEEFGPVKVDDVFMQKVHGHFKELAMLDTPDKYAELSPEEIVGLYYYYWHFGKSDLQYEMYINDDRFMQVPWTEYNEDYQPFKLPFDQLAVSLNFIDHGIGDYDTQTGIVQIHLKEEARNNLENEILTFQLIKTEDGWKIPFMPTQ